VPYTTLFRSDPGRRLVEVVLAQPVEEVADVAGGKVKALRAGRRHDVRGISDEEQAAKAHRLGHEGTQRRDRLLDRRADGHLLGRFGRKTGANFVPEALIRPVLDLVVERALYVVAAARVRAHRAKREPALVVRVNQLMADRRHFSDDSEPAERIDALIGLEPLTFHCLSGRPMIAIAACDEVAVEAVGNAILLVGDIWLVAVEIVRLDVGRLIDGQSPGSLAAIHQVTRE